MHTLGFSRCTTESHLNFAEGFVESYWEHARDLHFKDFLSFYKIMDLYAKLPLNYAGVNYLLLDKLKCTEKVQM